MFCSFLLTISQLLYHAEDKLPLRYEEQTCPYCSCQSYLCFMLLQPRMSELFVLLLRNVQYEHMDMMDIHTVLWTKTLAQTHTHTMKGLFSWWRKPYFIKGLWAKLMLMAGSDGRRVLLSPTGKPVVVLQPWSSGLKKARTLTNDLVSEQMPWRQSAWNFREKAQLKCRREYLEHEQHTSSYVTSQVRKMLHIFLYILLSRTAE